MTLQNNAYRSKAIRWTNLSFVLITTIGALCTPLYIHHYGIQASEIALMLFYMVATGLSVTVGYHRLFAHVTYKANKIIQALLLFFGAAAFEQSALKWSSQHRNHHQFTDTERDPYNIKDGFWYAHIGWILFWKQHNDYSNVNDLQASKMMMHQHQYYPYWAIFSGIILPVLIGFAIGRPLGAFLLAVCLRVTLVYHATFFINSICHLWGKTTYDPQSSAKDHWFVALLTYGEGYHNFHHRFPSDYRNGVRWYHYDPSKWLIALMARLGWAKDLKTVSKFRILSAQYASEHAKLTKRLENLSADQHPIFPHLKNGYQNLRKSLLRWETAAEQVFEKKAVKHCYKEYRKFLSEWQRVTSQVREFVSSKMNRKSSGV